MKDKGARSERGHTMRDRLPSTLRWAAVAIAIALLVTSAAPFARAQQREPSAATVAAWVQAFYDRTQTMSARFEQRYTVRVHNRVDTSRGTVRFKKPGMMRFDYDQPNGKIIRSDGQQLLAYEPPDGGRGPGQFFEQPMSDGQLPAALSFLTGTGRLSEDFRFRLLDAASLGFPQGKVLELRSRQPTPHYARIVLYVDDDAARRGIIHRITIVDQSQNQNQFDFTEQRFNTEIADTEFRWRPPRNARRIEPR